MCDDKVSYSKQEKLDETACDRTKDDFLTVYNKTYTRKSGFRPNPASHTPEYPDILAGPFTEYVVPNTSPQLEHPYERIQDCYGRLVAKDAKLKRYLHSEPDAKTVAADYSNRGRTVYMVDFCELEDGFESAKTRARRQVPLPTEWGEVPRTTQTASYRVPGKLATWDLKPRPCRPAPSVLQPNEKERRILQVSTGASEYMAKVGALGELVMQDQLHGVHQDNLQCIKYQQMLQKFNFREPKKS